MPLVIPAGYAQITHHFLCEGDAEPMLVTVGIATDADTQAERAQVCTDMALAWNDNLRPLTTVSYSLAKVAGLFGPDSAPFQAEHISGSVGTDDFEPYPPNTATLVKKLTAEAGRRGRGRFYWPGQVDPDACSAAGVIQPASVVGIQTAYDDWFAQVNANTAPSIQLILLHTDEVLPPTLITSVAVQSRLATQRRRLRGG